VDIAAPKAGVIKEYFAAEGDEVDVGADFYTLDTDAKAGDAKPAAASTPEPAATPKAEEAPKATPEVKSTPEPKASTPTPAAT